MNFQIIFLLNIAFVIGTLISSSKLTKCYNKGLDSPLNCSQKFIITLSLDNNQLSDSESLIAYINKLDTEASTEITLKNPIRITLSKSQTYALYPLIYQQDFNNKPYETVVESNIFTCEDAQYNSNPTCGVQYTNKGEKITYSQGYCCKCSFLQLIGLDNDRLTRGKICKALNLASGSATAHCLRFDDLWYSAFNIENPQIYYNIEIIIDYLLNDEDLNNAKSFYQTNIRLGSFKSTSMDNNNSIYAKIIGDFYPNPGPLELSNYYLMKPSFPLNDPRVLQGINRWMFIEKERFSLNGLECNKIGVSYSAFQNEAGKCEKNIGSCLLNQIDDFNNDDLNLMAKGLKPKYLLVSKGKFLASQNNDQISLLYELSGTMSTLITLEIKADDIKYITNLATGEIDSIIVPDFEAFSNNGQMIIMFTNTGDITSEFNLFVECDKYISSISSNKVFLKAFESKTLTLSIQTNKENSSNHTCAINLQDSIGTILDFQTVNFSTKGINYTSYQSNSSQDSAGVLINQPTKIQPNCDDICPNIYDIICSISNGCSGNIWKFFLIIFALFLTLGGCIFCIKRRGWCFLLSLCPKNNNSNYNNRDYKTRRNPPSQKNYEMDSSVYRYEKKSKRVYEDISLSKDMSMLSDNEKQVNKSNFKGHFIEEMYLNINKNDLYWKKFGFKFNFSTLIYVVKNEIGEYMIVINKESALRLFLGKWFRKNEKIINEMLDIVYNHSEIYGLTKKPYYKLLEDDKNLK